MNDNNMTARMAVLFAREVEASQPPYEGQAAVLACCDLFLAITADKPRMAAMNISEPEGGA